MCPMNAIKLAVLGAVISLLVIAVACGDDDATGPSGSPASPKATPPGATPPFPPEAELPLPDPWELHVAAVDGSGETMVYADDRAGQVAWSPDGSQLAIATSDVDSTTVRFVRLDGEVRSESTLDGYVSGLDWSPDGQYVTGIFTTGPTSSLLAVPSDGGGVRQFLSATDQTFIQQAGWLPSGELLVERGTSIAGAQLLAIDVDAGTSRELTSLDIYADYFGRPAISRDGTLLAVTVQMSDKGCGTLEDGSALWTIDIESGATTQVSPAGYCGSGSIVWSPDGHEIAFSVLGYSGNSGMFVTDLESHEARQVTTELDLVSAWLDDGTILAQRLTCIGCDAGPGKVIAIDSASGQVADVTEYGVHADVSPSGKIVAALDGIELLDTTGATVRVLAPAETMWQYTGFQWSPDESQVAYLRYLAPGQHIYEVNADGSRFETVAVHESANAKLSPDGSRLAYIDFADSTKDKPEGLVILANKDGSGPLDVPTTGVISFAWSPVDGGPLLFTAVDAPGHEPSIYLVNADGSGLREVPTSATISIGTTPPAWAPNGELVAFADGDIDVLNVDTGEVQTLARDLGKEAAVSWSADSTKLIYGGGFNGQDGSEIVIVNADGSGSETILSDDRYTKNGSIFSPDATRIAFLTNGSLNQNTRLVVANVDGSAEQMLAEGVLLASTSLAWSPDGQWIAFAMGLDGRRGLFLAGPDGSELRQLTRGAPITDIIWLDETTLRFGTYQGGL